MSTINIKETLLKLDPKKRIQFIILFGSVAEKRTTPLSDVDIAVYYSGSAEERFRFRMHALGQLPQTIDLQIFQDLPVALQKEILSGQVLFCRNFQFMFDQYMQVIKEFDSFEKYALEYYEVLEGAASGA